MRCLPARRSRSGWREARLLHHRSGCHAERRETQLADLRDGRGVTFARDAGQITLFDSVGFAIEDFSALRYVRHQPTSTGLYQELDMLADPDEPRDLFGMLLRAAQ